MAKVFIVGENHLIKNMFEAYGWHLTKQPLEADLFQFTGGADVDPSYYGEIKHPATGSEPERDALEANMYNHILELGKPMAGICRGGQFLNVMNGGSMWQHVGGHGIYGTHKMFDEETKEVIDVTSTHHQMMIPKGDYLLLATANCSSFKERPDGGRDNKKSQDVEVVFYPKTKSLCYQPHPEYLSFDSDCTINYFIYLEKYLNV